MDKTYGGLPERPNDYSEAFFIGVLNSLYEHVAVVRKDGSIIAVNQAWRDFAAENDAKSSEAVSEGVNYLEVCRCASEEEEEYARNAMKGLRDVIEGRADIFTMEYPCHSPEEERWFLMNVVPLQRPEGGAVVTHTDITRRKEAEDKLRENERYLGESREEYRALARQLITERESAKRRLARELHDSFGQRLALISMHASRFAGERGDGESGAALLSRIQKDISELSGELHDIARQLHPRILEDLGLGDAVASLCESFSTKEGVPVELKSTEVPEDLPMDTELNIYRIVQESLSNVANHAEASAARVSIEGRRDILTVSIEDNGKGFEAEAARAKSRLGLVSLRERAALIGGSLDILSSPGEGTRVILTLPLEAGEPRDC